MLTNPTLKSLNIIDGRENALGEGVPEFRGRGYERIIISFDTGVLQSHTLIVRG